MTSLRKQLLKQAKPMVICPSISQCILHPEQCCHSRPHNPLRFCKTHEVPGLACRPCVTLNLYAVVYDEQPA